ncbi:PREDICTED: cucumisin-like [Erythranthe guttata]|uniref:cucumisin-like n=1 Tax=Erythranthe guttata TaxID=4155 RepID=UPI00064D8FDB|nr:PREDICTED: cucumisin-like [Erythranthe guttata]|eukprot:XP_012835449.1 PREDICTED: cucumisin-like [Erythranthe guttata]
MKNPRMFLILYPFLLAALVLSCRCDERKLHIVYMGDLPKGGDLSVSSSHHTILQTVLGSASSAKESLVYSYERSFNGFAAKLTVNEAARIAEMEGVVSVNPNRMLKLHTTRSWDFMGFTDGNLGPGLEGQVIIGLLDTGVWPEHPSFNDTGFGPPPSKWKGTCQTATNFTCNNKIIGARYYKSDNSYDDDNEAPSPRDTEGHGTHTASTAGGVELPGTSFYGLAEGVARGGARNARIAVYKVCWLTGCSNADVLKAFDDAIADGVDILSVSLGSLFPHRFFDDPIAIGSFHAMQNGILTSNSAGNSGPDPVSVVNFAPWTLTVAASTIDRKFVANLVLGNGLFLTGISINSFDLNGTSYPLVWGGDAANISIGASSDNTRTCMLESDEMNYGMLAGAIVLCENPFDAAASNIFHFNGTGVIMVDNAPQYASSYPLPATVISPDDLRKVMQYIKTTKYPVATILVGEAWKDAMAPIVVSFSSRGPSPYSPDILKPDVTAPGVDILAGWSPLAPPSFAYGDTRSGVYFNVVSGTSMSCPHATAAAAYVKAAHPDWSPAVIKSAIMTTAYVMDPSQNTDKEFAYGSGHINPAGAVDPGLVFDASAADYINLLCKQGYNTTTLRMLTGDNSTCANTTIGRAFDFNYPILSMYVEDGQEITGTFKRTVTNVGPLNSTYTATWQMPSLISVTVEPSVLEFSVVGERKSFTVTVVGPAIKQQPIMSGAVTWSDGGSRSVRTPVVVYNYNYDLGSEDSKLSKPEKKKDVLKVKKGLLHKNYRNGFIKN